MNFNFMEFYSKLNEGQKKLFIAVSVIIAVLIIYFILFGIAKHIIIGKAKDYLVSHGIGSSQKNITLKVGANPFTCWNGKLSSVYLMADTVNVKEMFLLHNFEVKAKKVNLKELDNIEEDLLNGSVACQVNEQDFLNLLRNRLFSRSFGGVDVYMKYGMVYFRMGGSEYSANPVLKDNCIYLEFNDGLLSYAKPVKIVDFGAVTKKRLNVYGFEYKNGIYELKGNLI